MPNVYKPGLLQIRPAYTPDPDTGNRPENVTWWQSGLTTTPSLAQLQAIQAVFDTAWASVFTAYGATGMDYIGSVITDWSSNTGLEADSIGVFTPVSGGHGYSLPLQVSALISFITGERFHGGHFRTYLPYVGASSQDGTDPSALTSAAATAIGTAWGNVNTAMGGSGVLGGQQARMYRNRNNPTLAALWPVAEFLTPRRLATQRRRIRKVAHH